jgi:acyl carrier protein
MGLDSVEIIYRIETNLGITIPNQEAARLITVGDVHNLAWRYLQGRNSIRCKSQQLFYRLRHMLMARFNIQQKAIEPGASMNDIFPLKNRRGLYARLQKELQLKLPPLVLPDVWHSVLIATGLVLIVGVSAVSLAMVYLFNYTHQLLYLPLLGIVLTIFISHLMDFVRTVFEPASVKAFTREVVALNYATLTTETGANRKEVERVINNIICSYAAIELHEITPDQKIHDDLGID